MIPANWINQDGMIKARQDGRGDGNLPLYTALTLALLRALRVRALSDGNFADVYKIELELDRWAAALPHLVSKHEIKPGLVRRTPTDSGQETWDNMFGWIAISIVLDQPEVARRFLKYGFFHAGFFNTDGKLELSDNQWLKLNLWSVAVPAGFRPLAGLYRPYQRLIANFLNADHPGGILLDWLWFDLVMILGLPHRKFHALTQALPNALRDQLDPGHPAVGFAERLIQP